MALLLSQSRFGYFALRNDNGRSFRKVFRLLFHHLADFAKLIKRQIRLIANVIRLFGNFSAKRFQSALQFGRNLQKCIMSVIYFASNGRCFVDG